MGRRNKSGDDSNVQAVPMTFSAFDIMLPIGLGAVFGLVRYSQYVKDRPGNAGQLAIKDALTGMAGMGVMTVILKYMNML